LTKLITNLFVCQRWIPDKAFGTAQLHCVFPTPNVRVLSQQQLTVFNIEGSQRERNNLLYDIQRLFCVFGSLIIENNLEHASWLTAAVKLNVKKFFALCFDGQRELKELRMTGWRSTTGFVVSPK
jgi:hypothetical protein